MFHNVVNNVKMSFLTLKCYVSITWKKINSKVRYETLHNWWFEMDSAVKFQVKTINIYWTPTTDILKPRTWLGVNNYDHHTNLHVCATQLLWFALLQIIIHQVYEKNTWILGLEPQLLCQETAMRVYGVICQFSYHKGTKLRTLKFPLTHVVMGNSFF